MQNFFEIADAFVSNGAGVELSGDDELEEAFLSLMGDPGPARSPRGGCARPCRANRGADEERTTR